MSISGTNLTSSTYRNLIVNPSDETTDEKQVKKLNTATEELNAQQIAYQQLDQNGRVRITDDSHNEEQDAQAATLSVSYGVGQHMPSHTIPQTTPQDFTFDFSKSADYQLVGATNKFEDVDIEKSISQMKKDTVLDQYKYFVNPSQLGTDQDGTVKIVEWD